MIMINKMRLMIENFVNRGSLILIKLDIWMESNQSERISIKMTISVSKIQRSFGLKLKAK
jgi:hypothetical protein